MQCIGYLQWTNIGDMDADQLIASRHECVRCSTYGPDMGLQNTWMLLGIIVRIQSLFADYQVRLLTQPYTLAGRTNRPASLSAAR